MRVTEASAHIARRQKMNAYPLVQPSVLLDWTDASLATDLYLLTMFARPFTAVPLSRVKFAS